MYQEIEEIMLLSTHKFLSQKEYWSTKLTGVSSSRDLSFNPNQNSTGENKKSLQQRIPTTISAKLLKLSKGANPSLYIFLVAALKALIYRYTRQEDTILLSPVYKFNITDETLSRHVYLRDRVIGKMTFKELVLEVRKTVLEAYDNQDYPSEKILEYLGNTKKVEDTGHLAINNTILCRLQNIHNSEEKNKNGHPLIFSFERDEEQINDERNSTIDCNLIYDQTKYVESRVEGIFRHFLEVLEHATENVSVKIADLSLLSLKEREMLLFEFNRTETKLPPTQSIIRMFEQQVAKYPEKIAVECNNSPKGPEKVSFSELDDKAANLATAIRQRGIGLNSIVSLMVEPSLEMIIGILGILKAGGVFLPISPEFPSQRIRFMMQDSQSKLLLLQSYLTGKINETGSINKDILNDIIQQVGGEILEIEQHVAPGSTSGISTQETTAPNHPLYMVYTSGTTGKPKGVLLKNINLINYIDWFVKKAELTPQDNTALTSSYAFDLGYTLLFSPILSGGTLHILQKEDYLSPGRLLTYIRDHKITYIKITPSLFTLIANSTDFTDDRVKSLRLVLLGGEAINLKDVETAHKIANHIKFINHYGPTEATIGCVAQYIDFNKFQDYKKNPTIGKPINNTSAYILDNHLNQQPVGVPGELCISGTGLAEGYLNRPELTAEKFTTNPHQPGSRLYHTGDLARRLADGTIEFMGRIDHQVKVRGYRIELGEIENKLLNCPAVKEALVMVKGENTRDKYICAYLVAEQQEEQEEEISITAVREHLGSELPDYMIPQYFVQLDSIPLTPNGKVDRKALPEPTTNSAKGFEAPGNKIQQQLAKIWADVLAIEEKQIGIDDNFFELGGHSLKVTGLIGSVHKEMNVEVPIPQVFRRPTIREMARYITEAVQTDYLAIEPDEIKEFYPLSHGQLRLWIVSRMDQGIEAFNMSGYFEENRKLDYEKVEQAFNYLVERHESLRTTFFSIKGEPYQTIHHDVKLNIDRVDLSGETDEERRKKIREISLLEAHTPFDLGKCPLMRLKILKLSDTHHNILITMHHIISDGLSVNILLSEYRELYEALETGQPQPLTPQRLHYKDYARWEKKILSPEKLARLKAFWNSHFDGEIRLLNLPIDKPRGKLKTFNGNRQVFRLDPELTRLTYELTEKFNVTLYVFYLSIFNVYLSKICKQQDITVVSGTAGRDHPDLENIVGIFARGYGIKNVVQPDQNFNEFLGTVTRRYLDVVENNIYPFEMMVNDYAGSSGDRNVVNVHFNLSGLARATADQAGKKKKTPPRLIETEFHLSKDDFSLQVVEGPEGLEFNFEYNTDLFYESKINLLIAWFRNILEQVLRDPAKTMDAYHLSTGKEQELYRYLEVSNEEIENIIPLTPTQRDQYLNCAINPDSKTYREVLYKTMHNVSLQEEPWKEALAEIHRIYPILRSTMLTRGDDVYIGIKKPAPTAEREIDLEYIDLQHENLSEPAIYKRMVELTEHVDSRLDRPMTKYYLIKISPTTYVNLLSIHHIIFDGMSGKILFEKALELYGKSDAEKRNETKVTGDTYSRFHQTMTARFDTAAVEEYWTQKFSGLRKLQTNSIPGAGNKYRDIEVPVEPEHMEKIIEYCKRLRISVPLYFRSLFGYLIRYSTGSEGDFLIREITGGRTKETRNLIGCYYQSTPLVFTEEIYDKRQDVEEFFKYVYLRKKELGNNQYLSAFMQARLIGEEELKFYYNHHTFARADNSDEDAFVKVVHHPKTERLDDTARQVEFVTADRREGFELLLHYNEAIFNGNGFLQRLLEVSRQVCAGARKMGDIRLITEEERQEILHIAEGPAAAYPENKTVHGLFREQARKTPEKPALVFENRTMTYRQLDEQSDRLAAYLKTECSITQNQPVAVIMDRSEKIVITMLGILKAGAGYVPVDPDYPSDRIDFTLRDLAANIALVDSKEKVEHIHFPNTYRVISLEDQWEEIQSHPPYDHPKTQKEGIGRDLAYIIYTSGSTGKPKGVMVDHYNLVRLMTNDAFQFDFNETDVWTMFHSPSFDFSVWEMYGALLYGGKLVIIPKMIARDTEAYREQLNQHGVTVLNQTPTAFYNLSNREMAEQDAKLKVRYVIFGGEALHPLKLKSWKERYPETKLINMYGITETTVHVTYKEIGHREIEQNESNIGKPIPTNNVYILGKDQQLLPVETAGEICVGGAGAARGYLNRVELTSEKFIVNPFKPNADTRTGRLYRSGDSGKLSAEGELRYQGRIDRQVQLRGFRVELGEIENHLLKIDGIKEAVVIDRQAQEEIKNQYELGDIYLCAYVVADEMPEISEIRKQLAKGLTDYMIPSYYVQLKEIPLTVHGKVNRKKLPAPQASVKKETLTAPRNETEKEIARIWADALGMEVQQLDIDADFFEVGGHSLSATVTVSNIHKEMNVKIPLAQFFENPSIRELAEYVQKETKEKFMSIQPAEEKEHYELSSAQRRIWTLCQVESVSLTFNVPIANYLEGKLNPHDFLKAIHMLQERHESLRTVFITDGSNIRQKVYAPGELEIKLEQIDLRNLKTREDRENQTREHLKKESDTPFDLTRGPLIRAKLIRHEEEKYVLILTIHHIIGDFLSVEVMAKDLLRLYYAIEDKKTNPLTPLRIQYKDYTYWQNKLLKSTELKKHEDYWREQFISGSPELGLPLDKPRSRVQTYKGRDVGFEITGPMLEEFRALGEESTTTFMKLLALLKLNLYQHTGQKDIVVGIPIAGREHADLKEQIGLYINSLALRTQLEEDDTFLDLLNKVKKTTLNSYEHQIYPFDKLVESMGETRDLSRHPIFDVMVDMVNFDILEQLEIGGSLKIRPLSTGYRTSKFDLTIYIHEGKESVKIDYVYNTDLFEHGTVYRMLERFRQTMEKVLNNPRMPISSVIQEDPKLPQISRRDDRGQRIPLSYHQERLWFIDRFEAGNLYESSPVYHNIPLIHQLNGPVAPRLLEESIRTVIRRHPALRTRIAEENQKPYQYIRPEADFELEMEEWEQTPAKEIMQKIIREIERPFILDKEPLIRGKLIKLEEHRYIQVITIHHIIADHKTREIISREIFAAYNAALSGAPEETNAVLLDYADFAQWQRTIPPDSRETLYLNWKRKLFGKLQALEIPTDRPRELVHIYKAARQTFALPATISEKIKEWAKKEKLELSDNFVIYLAAFKILLHRYSGLEEIVVGTDGENRKLQGTENIAGPIANLQVLRSKIDESATIRKYISRLAQTVRDANTYQAMPFDLLVSRLAPEKDMSRTALFDILFRYQNRPLQRPVVKDHHIEEIETNLGWGKYDINMLIRESGEEIAGEVVYNADYYDETRITRMIAHYGKLLDGIVRSPEAPINTLELITEEEREQLLNRWNQATANYPEDITICRMFEEQVEQTPDRVAAVFEDQSLTYRQLNDAADGIAAKLLERGLKNEEIVGLMVERSMEMLIGIIAVIKAGGAYLPMDPGFPVKRLNYMLEDSGTGILLTTGEIPDTVKTGKDTINLKHEIKSNFKNNKNNKDNINKSGEKYRKPEIKPSNLLYIIYTSGTTGKPKGVMIEHRNLVRLFRNDKFQFEFSPNDTWTMFHSHSFDFSVWEMYGALLFGGKVVIIPKIQAQDTVRYHQELKKQSVTVLNQTPSAFYSLSQLEMEQENRELVLKYVIFGGEALNPAKLSRWKTRYPGTRLINMYGITETTVHVTYKEITEREIREEAGNIGQPIPTLSMNVMDKQLRLQPIGIPGELCVGGAGVARGYLNKVEQTHRKYRENPNAPGEKLYLSGDMGKQQENGDTIYMGRLDHQVQLRGFRIEPGEIETRLLEHPRVKEAVVIIRRDDNTDNYLCAYYVSPEAIEPEELRDCLAAALPEYMIPSHFVLMGSIPLTPNGKVDKEKLPEPSKTGIRETYIAPTTETEKKLARIFAEVLTVDAGYIGLDDSFFEMGGHSLKATTLVLNIHKEFDVKVPLSEVFIAPTVRGLTAYIENTAKEHFVSIEPAKKAAAYPLSSAQARQYFLQQLEPESTGYNMSAVVRLEGELDKGRIENTFRHLIQRHESFRTTFETEDNRTLQKIHDSARMELEYYDLTVDGNRDTETVNADNESIIREFIRPFDLSRAPLLRAGLVKTGKNTHHLMVDMHHIISDGASIGILLKEFAALYGNEQLPLLKLQYKDYSQWQHREESTEILGKQEKYWQERMEGEIPQLQLPTDFPRPPVQSMEGKTITKNMEPRYVEMIERIAREEGITHFMVMLSIYEIFLHKVTNQEDIIIGTPVEGRRHADLEPIIGMFVNTLPIRTNPKGGKTVKTLLGETKERILEAYENQEYQYEDIVEQVGVKRDTSRNPLFDTMFSYRDEDQSADGITAITGLKQTPHQIPRETAKFDLTLTVLENKDHLQMSMEYSTRLFREETIQGYFEYIKAIMEAVDLNKEQRISEINILSEARKKRLLYEYNNTDVALEADKTLQEHFECQADRVPDNTALIGTGSGRPSHHLLTVTYRTLNEEANRLAHKLRQQGVGPETIVALKLPHTIDLIIGILAILKAGGAYMPIGVDYPEERINVMLRDSGAAHMVTDENDSMKNGEPPHHLQVIDITKNQTENIDDIENLKNLNTPGDLAYVLYTSGTTGKPKGVMVEHRNVNGYIDAHYREIELTANDVLIQLSSSTFDAFVEELVSVLFRGGKMAIPTRDEVLDMNLLENYLVKHDITTIDCSPLLINEVNRFERQGSLRTYISGGDELKGEYIDRIIDKGKVYNTYGPTESTICAAYHKCSGKISGAVPIGKPIANYKVYIHDKYNMPVPPGTVGELCISGVGVTRGYLNRVELTREKYIDNPYEENRKIYRTGDLARWRPDGNIEFRGRLDQQVKIRGYRIELGEIENRLLTHPEIKEAAVMTRDRISDSGQTEEIENRGQKDISRYLCAYIVSEKEIDTDELKRHLRQTLPEYMQPAHYVRMQRLPMTKSGKLNRQALPAPQINQSQNDTAAQPITSDQARVIKIWSDVLHIKEDSIGIDTNYFDLGGNSLNSTIVISRVHKEFGVTVPLLEMFKKPTVREQAKYIAEKAVTETYSSIEPAERKEAYHLSSAQKRLYFIQQIDTGGMTYNMPAAIRIEGRLNAAALEQTFVKLIQRHESLRTTFHMEKKKLHQKIHPEVEFKLEHYDAHEDEAETVIKEFVREFDLSKAPLLRVGIARFKNREINEIPLNKYMMMVDMHHIISDGTSLGILIREFMTLYRGEQLPELKIQYKDFSEWQQRQENAPRVKKQENYWMSLFKTGIPRVKLPEDKPRKNAPGFTGDIISIDLGRDQSRQIYNLVKKTDTTLFMLLLAVYNVLLSRYAAQDEIVVGTKVTGRTHSDLQNVIGMFVNMLPLKNNPAGEKTFQEFLEEVKQNSIEAFENQDYPFSELVSKLKLPRMHGRNPLFDTVFALTNMETQEFKVDNLKITPMPFERNLTNFDLHLEGVEENDTIILNLGYSTDLFKKTTAEKLINRYLEILKQVLENPAIKLDEIDISHDLLISTESTFDEEGDFEF
jgi:iturin family lipopeptide synthetase B